MSSCPNKCGHTFSILEKWKISNFKNYGCRSCGAKVEVSKFQLIFIDAIVDNLFAFGLIFAFLFLVLRDFLLSGIIVAIVIILSFLNLYFSKIILADKDF